MKNNVRKIVFSCLIALVMIIASGGMLIRFGVRASAAREAEYGEAIMNSVEELIGLLRSDERERSSDLLRENNERIVRFMANMLKVFIAGENYTGPRSIGEGVVVELRDGKIIYPPEMKEGYVRLSDEEIEKLPLIGPEESFLGFMTEVEEESAESWSGQRIDITEEEERKILAALFCARIDDNYYYIERTEGEELYYYIDTSVGYSDYIQAAEQAFGGAILDLDEDDLQLNNESFYFQGVKDAGGLGLTKEMIDAAVPTVEINGTRYQCTYGRCKPTSILIYLHPNDRLIAQNTFEALLVTVVILLFVLQTVVFITSVIRYVSCAAPAEPQKLRKYTPESLKRKMLGGGILGSLSIFLIAAMIQSLGMLYAETMESRTAVDSLVRQFQTNEINRQEAMIEEEEEWIIYYGDQLASLLSEHPAFGTGEKLRDFSDTMAIDYVMLFDSNGNETACSHDYYNFSFGRSEGSPLHEFRALLKGIHSVRADAVTDEITGKAQRLIGVTVPDKGGKPGALLMSVSPQRLGRKDQASDAGSQLPFFVANGTLCLAADESGNIVEASDSKYLGNSIMQLGLTEDSLKDGYMSFLSLEDGRYYAVTVKKDAKVYYYITEVSSLFGHAAGYGLLAATEYAVIFLFLLASLLYGYEKKVFPKWAQEALKNSQSSPARITSDHEKQYSEDRSANRWNSIFLGWKQMLPEDRAMGVFRLCLCVLLLCCIVIEYSDDRFKLLGYIIMGDWMRGLNLFSVCAVFIILLLAFLADYLFRQLLMLITLFQSGRADTICRLIYSFSGYFLTFVVIYYAFTYMGFPTSAVLASVGLATLALTLGAQGMVADIIAGVAIVFEGAFQVGDIVELEGFWGKVEEIGIRTTKLVNKDNDVKIIENSHIKNLINKTKYNSICVVTMTVSAQESILRIEGILSEYLPQIGKKYADILSGPEYLGVSEVGNKNIVPYMNSMELLIIAECREENKGAVIRSLNRELIILFEEKNIRMF